MKTAYDAMMKRYSCRAFQKELLAPEIRAQLSGKIEELNRESGLHFQLFCSDDISKPAALLSDSMFSGDCYAFAALVGPEQIEASEPLGYYGEALVIFAEQLGLGTCWVASTYDPDSISVEIPAGEKLWIIIPLGKAAEQPPRQKEIRAKIRSRDRALDSFVESDVPFLAVPSWIQKGADAILAGPSAVNQQPVNLVWKDGVLTMKLIREGHHLHYCDMGIAKKQFEISAAASYFPGKWAFGDGAVFTLFEKT